MYQPSEAWIDTVLEPLLLYKQATEGVWQSLRCNLFKSKFFSHNFENLLEGNSKISF